jgi:hypothetical protein
MWSNLKLPGMGGSDFGGYPGLGGSMSPGMGGMSNPTSVAMSGGGMDPMGTIRKENDRLNQFTNSPGGGGGFSPMNYGGF